MKPQHDFIAERAIAQHCPELMARAKSSLDKGKTAEQLAARMCEALPRHLAPMLGKRLRIRASEASTQTAASLEQEISKPSASYAVRLEHSLPSLVSFEIATAVSLTDRLFGGDGSPPEAAPEMLPLSANLAIERIVCAIADATRAAEERDIEIDIRHDPDVARLSVFPRHEYCTAWEFTVEQEEREAWSFRFAVLESDLSGLSGEGQDRSLEQKSLTELASRAPMEGIPLPLTATLAETRMPLVRLATLQPGDVLAIPIMRDVPVRLGMTTIAHGSIGAVDERITLQITEITQTH